MNGRPTLPVSADAISGQVSRISRSPQFVASERLQGFLRFVVDETLAGRGSELKEHTIAVSVYRRSSTFDPKQDSIVRSEARRLRARLHEYYAGDGAMDDVRIELPVGRYVPVFSVRQSLAAAVGSHPAASSGADDIGTGQVLRRNSDQPGQPGAKSPRAWWRIGSAAAVAAVAGAIAVVWPGAEVSPRRPTTVLIVPFERSAGTTMPEGAIESAIEFSLAAARHVQVIPRIRVNDALRLMQREPTTPLTRELASEVALRDSGIDVVLTGRIVPHGDNWLLSAWLRNAETGRALAMTRHVVTNIEDGRAAAAIGAWVRVAVKDLDSERKELEPVATQSLEALQHFSRGMALIDEHQWVAAETLFRDAIAEDPDFASAYIFHAWALRNTGRPVAEALEQARRAEALASSASERERLFIRATVLQLEGRHADALTAFESLVELYPGDRWALRHLTTYASGLQAQRANAFWLRHADLRPNDPDSALLAASRMILTGHDPDGAQPLLDRARRLVTEADTRCIIEWLSSFRSWVKADPAPWLQVVRRLPSAPPRPRHVVEYGLLLLAAGRPDQARETFQRISDPVGASRWSAIAAAAAGDRVRLRKYAAELAGTRPNALSHIVLTWGNCRQDAERMFEDRSVSVVAGAAAEQIAAFWAVADAERRLRLGQRGADLEAQLEGAIRDLATTTNPEYFIAAYRLAELADAGGRRAQAVQVLEVAAARQAEAFHESRLFWLACLQRLASLQRQAGNVSRADTLETQLRQLLETSTQGFRPETLFRSSQKQA